MPLNLIRIYAILIKMEMQLPTKRCYYVALPAEKDRVWCWIPVEEITILAKMESKAKSLIEDYPLGLEIEVCSGVFAEFGIDFGVEPEDIRQTYGALWDQGKIPASHIVDGRSLEELARVRGSRISSLGGVPPTDLAVGLLPEPEMSEGDSPLSVFRRLAGQREL